MPRGKPVRQLGLGLGAEGRPVIKGGGFLRRADFALPEERTEFPFSIPAFRGLQRLAFHPAVTFFIGENGAAKSTLLEALAVSRRTS